MATTKPTAAQAKKRVQRALSSTNKLIKKIEKTLSQETVTSRVRGYTVLFTTAMDGTVSGYVADLHPECFFYGYVDINSAKRAIRKRIQAIPIPFVPIETTKKVQGYTVIYKTTAEGKVDAFVGDAVFPGYKNVATATVIVRRFLKSELIKVDPGTSEAVVATNPTKTTSDEKPYLIQGQLVMFTTEEDGSIIWHLPLLRGRRSYMNYSTVDAAREAAARYLKNRNRWLEHTSTLDTMFQVGLLADSFEYVSRVHEGDNHWYIKVLFDGFDKTFSGSNPIEQLRLMREEVSSHIKKIILDGEAIPYAKPLQCYRDNWSFSDRYTMYVTSNGYITPSYPGEVFVPSMPDVTEINEYFGRNQPEPVGFWKGLWRSITGYVPDPTPTYEVIDEDAKGFEVAPYIAVAEDTPEEPNGSIQPDISIPEEGALNPEQEEFVAKVTFSAFPDSEGIDPPSPKKAPNKRARKNRTKLKVKVK
jgi:hypothetical protein